MAAPRYRAISDVLLGGDATAHPGEIVPQTFHTHPSGEERDVDFERLLALGAVELDEPKARRRKAAEDEPAEPDANADPPPEE